MDTNKQPKVWSIPEEGKGVIETLITPEGRLTLEVEGEYVYIFLTRAFCPKLVSRQERSSDLVGKLNIDISDYYLPLHKYVRIIA